LLPEADGEIRQPVPLPAGSPETYQRSGFTYRSATAASGAVVTREVGYRPCVVNVAAISVLVELGTATWSEPQAIAYETAQEGVRQAIGYYAHLIGEEEAAAEPDTAAIAEWREAQQAWAARGQELTPLETRAIKRIRADADKLLSVDVDDEDDDTDDDTDDDETDDDSDDDADNVDDDDDENDDD